MFQNCPINLHFKRNSIRFIITNDTNSKAKQPVKNAMSIIAIQAKRDMTRMSHQMLVHIFTVRQQTLKQGLIEVWSMQLNESCTIDQSKIKLFHSIRDRHYEKKQSCHVTRHYEKKQSCHVT